MRTEIIDHISEHLSFASKEDITERVDAYIDTFKGNSNL